MTKKYLRQDIPTPPWIKVLIAIYNNESDKLNPSAIARLANMPYMTCYKWCKNLIHFGLLEVNSEKLYSLSMYGLSLSESLIPISKFMEV